jgi:membrane protein implicated in regulation of membrane protease activity
MKRYSRLWWTSLLLSSGVTGGASFISLSLLTDWTLLPIITASLALILVGDVVLALMMQAVSPTDVKVGPGERLHRTDLPQDVGTVVDRFADGHGRVAIRGEIWHARRPSDSVSQLEAGAAVRVLGRDGLTLLVTPADGSMRA